MLDATATRAKEGRGCLSDCVSGRKCTQLRAVTVGKLGEKAWFFFFFFFGTMCRKNDYVFAILGDWTRGLMYTGRRSTLSVPQPFF